MQKVTSERCYFRWVLGVLKHKNLLEWSDGIYWENSHQSQTIMPHIGSACFTKRVEDKCEETFCWIQQRGYISLFWTRTELWYVLTDVWYNNIMFSCCLLYLQNLLHSLNVSACVFTVYLYSNSIWFPFICYSFRIHGRERKRELVVEYYN